MVDEEDSWRENSQRKTWKLPVCEGTSPNTGTVLRHHFALVKVVTETIHIKGRCIGGRICKGVSTPI